MVCLSNLQIFKGCLPKILLGPFLNTLYHITMSLRYMLRIRSLLVIPFSIRSAKADKTKIPLCFNLSLKNHPSRGIRGTSAKTNAREYK